MEILLNEKKKKNQTIFLHTVQKIAHLLGQNFVRPLLEGRIGGGGVSACRSLGQIKSKYRREKNGCSAKYEFVSGRGKERGWEGKRRLEWEGWDGL